MTTAWTNMLAGAAIVAAMAVVGACPASASKTSKKAAPPTTAFDGRPSGWTVVADTAPDSPPTAADAAPALEAATVDAGLSPTAASAVISVGSLDGPSLGDGYAVLLSAAGPASVGGDALTCLTQAVYFEARSEPIEGQEAVAQVVMNRTRLPQYPRQVCDVVFQGADRPTGCQFSFTCNGVLGPPTEADAWRRANAVAGRALAGFVYAPLKDATHFHATWVNPYWSGSLTRLGQVGGHVFYH